MHNAIMLNVNTKPVQIWRLLKLKTAYATYCTNTTEQLFKNMHNNIQYRSSTNLFEIDNQEDFLAFFDRLFWLFKLSS